MRTFSFALLFVLVAGSAVAHGQGNWDRTYPLTARPSLQVDVDSASVRVRSCGGCRAIHIHVDPHGADLSKWKVVEMQGGNGIHFALKRRDEGVALFGSGWHGQSPEVLVEAPSETDLNLHSGDGSLQVAGLRGTLDLKSGDGSVRTDDTAGSLRITTGDGSIQVHRAEGALNAGTGDGSMNLEGRLHRVDVHSGDGSVQLSMLPGSQLEASSSVTSGDGSIHMRVPGDLRANLQATSGDGSIRCDLPMNSTGSGRHGVSGQLNGGGPTLKVTSGDGSILIGTN